ncbi:MAG: MBL fold metallo-hydrolase, partial [Chloroflexi bacterium]|nr:MBL fold metallo-hydrolase [Chloroflexota bacterium]
PFGSGRLRYIRDVEESKALNERTDPMVIISASGMCEGGRILHHLKNNIKDPRNTVLFVGFQAEHTLGRRILERREEVPIFGEPYRLNAHVESIDGYSAHADRQELLDYVSRLGVHRLKRVYVIHGEEEASFALADGLHELGVRKTKVPEPGERVKV